MCFNIFVIAFFFQTSIVAKWWLSKKYYLTSYSSFGVRSGMVALVCPPGTVTAGSHLERDYSRVNYRSATIPSVFGPLLDLVLCDGRSAVRIGCGPLQENGSGWFLERVRVSGAHFDVHMVTVPVGGLGFARFAGSVEGVLRDDICIVLKWIRCALLVHCLHAELVVVTLYKFIHSYDFFEELG